MTKEEVEMIINRYTFIVQAINANKEHAVFYLGNRKFSVEITESVIAVCEIIRDVYSNIKDIWLKFMVDGILSNKTTDISLIMQLPWQKNAFYKRKDEFFNTIFLCCAAKNIISYEEILAGVA